MEPLTPAPLAVPEFTPDVASEVGEIARALPYRSVLGVDPERVIWVDVAGEERIGVAYAPDDPDGPHWMIAITRPDARPVRQRRVREIVDLVAGGGAAFERAPDLGGPPNLTMVRVPIRR